MQWQAYIDISPTDNYDNKLDFDGSLFQAYSINII